MRLSDFFAAKHMDQLALQMRQRIREEAGSEFDAFDRPMHGLPEKSQQSKED